MLSKTIPDGKTAFRRGGVSRILALSALCAALGAPPAAAAPAPKVPASGATLAPCTSISVAEPARVTLGKSTLVRLPAPVVRMVVGGMGSGAAGRPLEGADKGKAPAAAQSMSASGDNKNGVADADIMLLSPSELYVIGKRVGSMNLILQSRNDQCTVMDIAVAMDSNSLQAKFAELMPGEKGIKVAAAEDSLILSGEVADSVKLDRALALAAAYAPEKRVVNLLRAAGAHQVMLEVKVAEVSKNILDKLGARLAFGTGTRFSLLSNFLSGGGALLEALSRSGKSSLELDAEVRDGIVRVLAEPNIMAVSGQQASFLSGGKIFIPVSYTPAGGLGFPTITLEEKEFGVGVKFTPTVLDGNRINLKVASEVSELSQTGSPFTTAGGVTSILPSFTTRRADTTVQLRDGQSFAIAGLIKNNLTETVKGFPGLSEIPILGALFRSTEFQKDMTELLFIITPRLVKPLPPEYALPTDAYQEPSRANALLNGALEAGKPEAPKQPAPVSDAGEAPKSQPAPGKAAAAGDAKPAPQPAATSQRTPVPPPAPQPAPAAAPEAPVATTQPVPLPDAPRLLPAAGTRPPAKTGPQAGTRSPPVVADAGTVMSAEAIGRFYAE